MQKTIIEQLKERELKVSKIAKDFKVDRSTVYQSIRGSGSRRVRVHIAKLLNKTPSELWCDNETDVLRLDTAIFIMENQGGAA